MLRLQSVSVTCDNANYKLYSDIDSGGGEAKKKGLRACTCLHWMELEQYYSKTAEAKEPYTYQQEVNYPLSA